MKKVNELIRDFIKCIINGSAISLGIILVVGLISLLVTGFDFQKSIQVVRSTLLIIGPLGIILGAILILKNRNEEEFSFIDQWKKKYKVFSYKIVIILISFIIILYGGIIDWIIFTFMM